MNESNNINQILDYEKNLALHSVYNLEKEFEWNLEFSTFHLEKLIRCAFFLVHNIQTKWVEYQSILIAWIILSIATLQWISYAITLNAIQFIGKCAHGMKYFFYHSFLYALFPVFQTTWFFLLIIFVISSQWLVLGSLDKASNSFIFFLHFFLFLSGRSFFFYRNHCNFISCREKAKLHCIHLVADKPKYVYMYLFLLPCIMRCDKVNRKKCTYCFFNPRQM